MRLLVFGSRGWQHAYTIFGCLDRCRAESHGNLLIISGGARGADAHAEQWAKENGVNSAIYHADWEKHGKRAGYIRNVQMVEEGKPTHALGFWDGKSKGTAMMIDILASIKIPRRIVTDDAGRPWEWTF